MKINFTYASIPGMNKNGKKDFRGWIILKEKIHNENLLWTINDGDIWWCAIGENVGKGLCTLIASRIKNIP